jgi:MFS family permease
MAALPRRTILGLCCAGMFSIALVLAGPAICQTAIARELGLNTAQSGLFLSCSFYGLALAVLLAGPLADRLGFRALLAAAGVFEAAGLMLLSRAGGLAGLCAGAMCLGFGAGIGDALFTPLVCVLYPHRRTQMTNLLHAFYPIGLIGIVLGMLGLLGAGWHWRSVYLLLAILPAPWVLAALVLPLPRHAHQSSARLRVRELLGRGRFWVLLGAILAIGTAEIGASNWLPSYVEYVCGAASWAGGLGLMCFGLTMAIGRLGTSALAGRLGPRRLFLAGGALCSLSLLLAAMGAQSLGPVWTVGCLAVFGLGCAGFWPTILGCAGDAFPAAGASMYSTLSAVGNFGGVLGPWIIGLIGQHAGLSWAMGLMAVGPAISAALMVWPGNAKTEN